MDELATGCDNRRRSCGVRWMRGIMKRLMTLLMLCAVGLCGYQLGRLPGSPDAVGWLRQQADSIDLSGVAEAAEDFVASGREEASAWATGPAEDSTSTPPPAAALEPPRPARPRCW